ncbi:MAG: glucokinase [Acidobacteriota bacterium]|jgi:glucokinase
MLALGIDLADVEVRGVAVDGDGTILRRGRGSRGRAGLRDLLDELSAGHRPDAIGLAADAPGAPLEGAARWPVALVCTPGAAAVVAESWLGGARGARHALCLLIGDRVIAGLLLNGEPWVGAHGFAGAAAWFALNPVERQDYRRFGNLAAEVSNEGIARRLAWRVQAGDESVVIERAGSLEAITALHVFDGARAADGVAISVVRETAKYIGMALANMASLLDPEIIVLGGTVAGARDLLLEPIRQECARRLPPGLVDQFRFAMSDLGPDVVAIGAARLAMHPAG